MFCCRPCPPSCQLFVLSVILMSRHHSEPEDELTAVRGRRGVLELIVELDSVIYSNLCFNIYLAASINGYRIRITKMVSSGTVGKLII